MKTINKKLSITSLLTAVKLGKVKQIKISLAQHGLPNNAVKTTDYLILQTAVNRNYKEIVELLINAGCRVNACDSDGDSLTPLALAIMNENEEIASLLLKNRANFDVGSNSADLTVLHTAAEQKSLKMLHLLIENGADINCVRQNKTAFEMFFDSSYPYTQLDNRNDVDIFKFFLSNKACININHKWSVLHFVATTNHKDIIKSVVPMINDINQCTSEGNTGLHHLLQQSSLAEEDIFEIVELFILEGARIDIANSHGDTAVHLAASKKYLKVLQVFLKCHWDVNCCNCKGDTVLHIILENSTRYRNDDLFCQVVTSILNMDSFKFIKNNQGKSSLHLAIENGHRLIVNDMLVKPNIDVNATVRRLKNYTYLHLYLQILVDSHQEVDDLDVEIVRKFMSLGAQSDIVSDEKERTTPVHFALILKNKSVLQLLLENFNFEKFSREQNKSILHLLCYNIEYSSETEELDIVEIVKLCIEKGADINVRDEQHKQTALCVATLRRQKHMVKTLLDNGIQINDFEAKAILGYLMESQFVQIIYSPNVQTSHIYYTSQVINVTENVARDIEILEALASKGLNLDDKSNNGLTIFHYAASKKSTEMLQKLLPYCRYPNICDPNKNTVLHLILDSYTNTGSDEEQKLIEIVSTLLSKEASVMSANIKGETPLHLAAKNKHFEIVTMLLQHDANPTKLDFSGNSMLHFLSMVNVVPRENVEIDLMKLFVSHGCDVNAKNEEGRTPLLLSARSGCTMITRILLQHGAQMDCTANDSLFTPLHIAAGCNHSGVVEELIKFGVDLNARTEEGVTALHLSSTHKESTVTRILLENGGDSEVRDNNGGTPLHYACWNDSSENINELLSYGADVNAEDKFHVVPVMLTSNSTEVWTILYNHITKLQAANMSVSTLTVNCIVKYEQARSDNPIVANARDIVDSLVAEISWMKETPIHENFVLVDLLHMKASNLHSFDSSLHQFLFSDDFSEQFPLYGGLIRAYYRKNLIRGSLFTAAKDAFKNIAGLTLEERCCYKIFDHLSNQDLRHLDKAAKISVRKRKSLDENKQLSSPSPVKRPRSS